MSSLLLFNRVYRLEIQSVMLFSTGLVTYCPSNLGLGPEFRSEKIPRNRLGTVSVIPRKKVLIPRHSEFRGRASSEARNETELNGIPRKENMTPTVDIDGLLFKVNGLTLNGHG